MIAPARDVRALRGLLPFLRPYRVRIALAGLFLLLAAGATLVLPVALRSLIDQGLMHQGLQTLDEDPPGGFLSRPATEPSNRCNSHVMLRCSKNYDKGPHILVIPAA